jgi:hypothetical protein
MGVIQQHARMARAAWIQARIALKLEGRVVVTDGRD